MKTSGRKFILVILGIVIFISVSLFFGNRGSYFNSSEVESPTPVPFRTPNEVISIQMIPQIEPGQSGTAELRTYTGNKTKVDIMVNGATSSAQPTYIHEGNCGSIGVETAVLVYAKNGKSQTIIDNSLSALLDTPHAVVIHQSITQYKNISSCANISK